ncbi:MAG: cobalt-precorrin 5A hydrolase [Clostridia bacterium]|nr:cobalt-precorrin 5A hydrolase [Clostridia bacterium]
MKSALISLTRNGADLACSIGLALQADVFVKPEFAAECMEKYYKVSIKPIKGRFNEFIGDIFGVYEALVFIMASGIVVRSIAPYIKDKKSDPAVLVLDEKGVHVISLLSGHLGGANVLAREVALITGGTPVITTATDINDMIAFDVFAKENNCVIENLQDMKYISAELVNGGRVRFYSDYMLDRELPENIMKYDEDNTTGCKYVVILSNRTNIEIEAEKALYIRPKNLILGLGCRRGTSKEEIALAVRSFFEKNNKSMLSLKGIATIDLKMDEMGLLKFCSENGIALFIVQRDQIRPIEDDYTTSEFVKTKTGVASVAEPCAVLAGENARLICGKTVYKGITLALAEEEKIYNI